MAFYDKSARMMYAVGLSLVIHAVIIGLLVGTQVFSDGSPKADSAESSEPTPKDSPEPEKPAVNIPPAEPAPGGPWVSEPTESPAPEPAARPRSKKEPKARPKFEAETKEPSKVEAKPKTETSETEIYVVKKGESLSSIARAHGCTLAELTKLNKTTLKKNKSLFVGAKLRVPRK